MAWIESHDTIWEHHKTIKLCRLLEIGRAQAVGHLHALWHFVLRNAWRDANLEAWGDVEIERASFWEGKKGAYTDALREAGFLDGFTVHGWVERAGRLVGDRLYNEQRRKSYVKRPSKRRKSLATLPNPTLPNQTVPNQTENKREVAKFTPPSPLEAADYATSIGFSLDGEQFCAFYQAKGWVVGRSPMRDWRAAVRTWKIREKHGGFSAGNNRGADKPVVGGAKPVPGKYANVGHRITVDGVAGSVGDDPGTRSRN